MPTDRRDLHRRLFRSASSQGGYFTAAQAREIGYFTRNAERMRYGSFLKHGYQIATGVMEAACKQVVHQRLDQVGMHWRQETAEAFVALRAAVLSSSPPDLRPYCRMSYSKLPGS